MVIGEMSLTVVQIQSGYFSHKMVNEEVLQETKGRGWGEYFECLSVSIADGRSEDIVH